MRRRPRVDVVSTSIRRQLNVNTTRTLKQPQLKNLYNANVGTMLFLRIWYVNVNMTSTQ